MRAKFGFIEILFFAAFLTLAGRAGAGEEKVEEDWSFGGGAFGRWTMDGGGLPAYEYQARYDDPRLVWDPKVYPPSNLHWSQIGNDRVMAACYNLGFVKLFDGSAGAVWINDYEPEKGEFAGGFGWLAWGDTVVSDYDASIGEDAGWKRVFGAYYYEKTLETAEAVFRHTLVPTPNTDSARTSPEASSLYSFVTIRNKSDRPISFTHLEYWDVNVKLMDDFLLGRAGIRKRRDKKVSMRVHRSGTVLEAASQKRLEGPPSRPALVFPEWPSAFLESMEEKPDAWITDPSELFNGKEMVISRISSGLGSEKPDPAARGQNEACLAARKSFVLEPGEEKTIAYRFGCLYPYAADWDQGPGPGMEAASELARVHAAWRDAGYPAFISSRDSFMGRELVWDYYYLTAMATSDIYYGKRHVPQGGNYYYYSGGNGATRDYAAFVQALTYYKPELAREILEFMSRCQETDGRLFYDIEGYGYRYSTPYRPGDLDLWYLWALCEYVFATRDFDLLDQGEPFYPLHLGEEGTVWEHARRSLDHLIDVIGTGPRGHLRLRLSDWNDEMTWLTAGSNPADMLATFYRGESVMNTAMACHILPMFRDLAKAEGDAETAGRAEAFLVKLRAALDSAWTGTHFTRAYSGFGKPFGQDETYLEPQVWALLAGDVLGPERERKLLDNLRANLMGPSELGMMISTSTSGSLTTRPGEQEEGGIWLAINGPAALALARSDPDLAWREVKRNSMAWHAHVYPNLWYGIWSGPDAWNSVFSDRPGETWYMKTPILNTGPQMYPVQNAHSHCQTMWVMARLAGISPFAEGLAVEPRVPLESYSFSCRLFSISKGPDEIAGSLRVGDGGPLKLRVEIPENMRGRQLAFSVNGEKISSAALGDYVECMAGGDGRGSIDFKLTASKPQQGPNRKASRGV